MDPYHGGYPPPLSYPPGYGVTARPAMQPHHPTSAAHLPPHLRPPTSVPNFPVGAVSGAPTSYTRPIMPTYPAYPSAASAHGLPQPVMQFQQTPATTSTITNPVENKATVYVGKIAPTVEDDFMRKLLEVFSSTLLSVLSDIDFIFFVYNCDSRNVDP